MLLKKKVEVNTKEGRKMTYLEIRRTPHNESHDVLPKIVVRYRETSSSALSNDVND